MSRRSSRGRSDAVPRKPADHGGNARSGGSAGWRSPGVLGAAAVIILLVAGGIAAVAIGGGSKSSARPSASAVAAGSSAPLGSAGGPLRSDTGASAGPSVPTGGKLAEALVAALHANPFVAHFDESVLSSSLTGGRRLTLTAKAVGDVSGRDVSIESTTTGGGPATDQRFVSVGDVAWFRSGSDTVWTAAARSSVAGSIDQLLATIQVIDDPKLLADLGVEDLDGQSVHHLTAESGVPFQLPNGVQGDYATFDVWATEAGVPVLVKSTFVQVQGINSTSGGVDIRYTKVGGPITIAPPAGAPTLAP